MQNGYKNLFTNINMNYIYDTKKLMLNIIYGADTIAKGALKSYWLKGESKGKSCEKAIMFISYSLQVQTVYMYK